MSGTKPCASTNLATDDTALACEEYFSTECIIHPDAMVELGLEEDSDVRVIFNAILNSLINLNNQLGAVTNPGVNVLDSGTVVLNGALKLNFTNDISAVVDGVDSDQVNVSVDLPEYTIGLDGSNILSISENGSIIDTVDLSGLLDDTNLARIVSGEVVGTDLVFTRDDTTEITIDLSAFEPALGNPASDGYVLSSTTAGVRSWIPFPSTVTPSGLELISEGGNDGWRLIGEDPVAHEDIGNQAIDFTVFGLDLATGGATGNGSFAAGFNNVAAGQYDVVFGNINNVDAGSGFAANSRNEVTGQYGAAFNYQNTIEGARGFATGSFNTVGAVAGSGAAFGLWNYARSGAEMAVGQYGTDYTPDGTNDRSFNVGVGTADGNRLNGLTVLKSGEVFAPSMSNAQIDAATDDVLLTKDWFSTFIGDYVTLDTAQTITAFKIFDLGLNSQGPVFIGGDSDSSSIIIFNDDDSDTLINGNSSLRIFSYNDMFGIRNSTQTGGPTAGALLIDQNNTEPRTATFQDSDGTVAYLSDIPTQTKGTFTPTLVDAGGGATYSFTIDTATYVRTGDLVFFQISLSDIGTTGTPSGDLQIGDLPFTVENVAALNVYRVNGSDVNFYSVTARAATDDLVKFSIQDALDGDINTLLGSVTFTSGAILLSGTYETTD